MRTTISQTRLEYAVRRMIFLGFTALVLASTSAEAEQVFDTGGVRIDVAESPAYTACFQAADGNDLAMAACISAEADRWDKRLNVAYGRMRAQLAKNDFAVLQAFQRAWISDRDAACRDAACRDDGQGGTEGRLNADGCYLRLTAVRAAELEMRASQRP